MLWVSESGNCIAFKATVAQSLLWPLESVILEKSGAWCRRKDLRSHSRHKNCNRILPPTTLECKRFGCMLVFSGISMTQEIDKFEIAPTQRNVGLFPILTRYFAFSWEPPYVLTQDPPKLWRAQSLWGIPPPPPCSYICGKRWCVHSWPISCHWSLFIPPEKNIFFSYVFRGYRKIPRYGLNIPQNSVDCRTITCVQFIGKKWFRCFPKITRSNWPKRFLSVRNRIVDEYQNMKQW